MPVASEEQDRGMRQESAQVTEPAQVEQLCDEAVDVAGFIRGHVVQAQLNERGNYGASFELAPPPDPLLRNVESRLMRASQCYIFW